MCFNSFQLESMYVELDVASMAIIEIILIINKIEMKVIQFDKIHISRRIVKLLFLSNKLLIMLK